MAMREIANPDGGPPLAAQTIGAITSFKDYYERNLQSVANLTKMIIRRILRPAASRGPI
jgi:hypothetical protein